MHLGLALARVHPSPGHRNWFRAGQVTQTGKRFPEIGYIVKKENLGLRSKQGARFSTCGDTAYIEIKATGREKQSEEMEDILVMGL